MFSFLKEVRALVPRDRGKGGRDVYEQGPSFSGPEFILGFTLKSLQCLPHGLLVKGTLLPKKGKKEQNKTK